MFVKRFMSDWINSHFDKLLLDVGIPVIFYLVVCSSRQLSSNLGPPKTIKIEKEKKVFLLKKYMEIIIRRDYFQCSFHISCHLATDHN